MITVLIPGGFKPPHVGHYKFFMHYINNPEVSEVRIFCGERQRKVGDAFAVSIERAEAVLRLYGILDNPKVIYQRASVRKGRNTTRTLLLMCLIGLKKITIKRKIKFLLVFRQKTQATKQVSWVTLNPSQTSLRSNIPISRKSLSRQQSSEKP